MRKISLDEISNFLLYLAVFLLPWQTRWIFGALTIEGIVWEFGILSVYAVEILLLVVFVARSRRIVSEQFKNPLAYGALFLFVAAVSVFGAFGLKIAANAFMHLSFALLLFYLLLDGKIKVQKIILCFTLGLIAPAIFGFLQVFSGASPAASWLGLAPRAASQLGDAVTEVNGARMLRAYGSFGHPNIFGGWLATGLFLTMLLPRWFGAKKLNRYLIYALASVFAVMLILTFSRSAWIGFLAGFLVFGFVLLWKQKNSVKKILPFVAVALASTVLTIFIFRDPFLSRANPSSRIEEKSISERTAGYFVYPSVIKGKELFGVGVGNYALALREHFPNASVYSLVPIHNALLLALAEIGIVGFIFLAFFIHSVDSVNYRNLPKITALASLGLGTILLFISFFDHYLWSLWSGLSLTGFALAIILRLSTEDHS